MLAHDMLIGVSNQASRALPSHSSVTTHHAGVPAHGLRVVPEIMSTNLLRISEAMERLACSRQTIYRLAKTGDLRFVRLGRAVRVPAADVENFIAAHLESEVER